jgi:hypothetical protein
MKSVHLYAKRIAINSLTAALCLGAVCSEACEASKSQFRLAREIEAGGHRAQETEQGLFLRDGLCVNALTWAVPEAASPSAWIHLAVFAGNDSAEGPPLFVTKIYSELFWNGLAIQFDATPLRLSDDLLAAVLRVRWQFLAGTFGEGFENVMLLAHDARTKNLAAVLNAPSRRDSYCRHAVGSKCERADETEIGSLQLGSIGKDGVHDIKFLTQTKVAPFAGRSKMTRSKRVAQRWVWNGSSYQLPPALKSQQQVTVKPS